MFNLYFVCSKVYQQSIVYTCCGKIIDKLNGVGGCETLHSLQFQNQHILHNNVGFIFANHIVVVVYLY